MSVRKNQQCLVRRGTMSLLSFSVGGVTALVSFCSVSEAVDLGGHREGVMSGYSRTRAPSY